MVKAKPENQSTLRTPGPKKKLGLSVPPALRLPHDDLIGPTTPSQTSQSSQTSLTSQGTEPDSVAPQRDFTKTPNSIVRDVLPGGHFKGKSKQLYDCLFALTRGAIAPTRKVRISRPKLMAKAHIGARVTFEANIAHLKSVGLIRVINIIGEHEGNEYEVFLPEEISMPSHSSIPSQTSQTRYAQKLDRLVRLETSQTRHTSSPEESTTYEVPKTFFKTNTEKTDDDDAALAGLVATLKEAAKEITGRELSAAESERWRELGDVLVAELKIAAARTTVSSVPSFLAEHLRRRLWKVDKRQAQAEGRELPDEALKKAPTMDASKCPDCAGSGWHYPEGLEKGVRKCRHDRLNMSQEGEQAAT
jgi:hypothetical protein